MSTKYSLNTGEIDTYRAHKTQLSKSISGQSSAYTMKDIYSYFSFVTYSG